jgi:hypothetical protein
MNKIKNVPIEQIVPDPEVPLFRGPIHNTVSLQESISQSGIQQPLWVRVSPEDDKVYFLFDGSRRYHAAKQLELKKVPCLIKEATAEEARQLAMISSQSEKWPHIVLDKDGAVIGGNCLAVKFSIDPEDDDKDRPKVKRYMVAEWLGLTSDVVGALYSLYDEPIELKRLVEKGHIDITVYSLFKTAPQEVKDYMAGLKMPLSAGRVRQVLKNWEKIKAELVTDILEDEEPVEAIEETEELAPVIVEEEESVARCLNNALMWLKRVNGHELSPSDLWLVKEIDQVVSLIGGSDDE